MTTKLIIIEGLPGLGKSTTARMVYDILKSKGIKSELFSEGDYNHPADYDGVAYFSDGDFNKLKNAHLENENILNEIKIRHGSGYLIPYRKIIEEKKISFPDRLLSDITKNNVYELPLDLHTVLILNRWEDFVNRCVHEDKTVVFECCFIQNPVTMTMIKNNSAPQVTIDYVQSLAKRVVPLKPILLFLEQKNIETSLKKAISERPKEWFESFEDYYTNQGYGLDNNLKGLDGVISILKSRYRLEQEIFESLSLTKYRIDNSAFDLNLHRETIGSILEPHLPL